MSSSGEARVWRVGWALIFQCYLSNFGTNIVEVVNSARKLISDLQHFSQRKTSILGQRQHLDFKKHKSEPW